MCWACDLIGAAEEKRHPEYGKKNKNKIRMGAVAMLCGHNIDKYDLWYESQEFFWEDGVHICRSYPTDAMVVEIKKIYGLLKIPAELDERITMDEYKKEWSLFFREMNHTNTADEALSWWETRKKGKGWE